jgi:hypothetical protein
MIVDNKQRVLRSHRDKRRDPVSLRIVLIPHGRGRESLLVAHKGENFQPCEPEAIDYDDDVFVTSFCM